MYYDFIILLKNDHYESAQDLLKLTIDHGYLDDVEGLLKQAIKNNNFPMVGLLLDDVLNPNFYYYDESPLDMAIQTNFDMMPIILKAGANPNNQNKRGDTSLMIALEKPRRFLFKIVELLIQYGANPNIQNKYQHDAYYMLNRIRGFLSNDQYQEILNLLDSYNEVKDPGYY